MARHSCSASCPKRRHAMIRKLLDACVALSEAADDVLDLPPPDPTDVSGEGWRFVRQNLAGLTWALDIAATAVEGEHRSCCWARRTEECNGRVA